MCRPQCSVVAFFIESRRNEAGALLMVTYNLNLCFEPGNRLFQMIDTMLSTLFWRVPVVWVCLTRGTLRDEPQRDQAPVSFNLWITRYEHRVHWTHRLYESYCRTKCELTICESQIAINSKGDLWRSSVILKRFKLPNSTNFWELLRTQFVRLHLGWQTLLSKHCLLNSRNRSALFLRWNFLRSF